MNKRILVGLVVAVAVLTVLAIVGQRGDNTTRSDRGALLAPGLDEALNDVERVTLTKAGGEVVATLERRPENWVVAEKSDYRADVGKIRQGLVALAEARILEQKTANPEYYGRLGVEDVSEADAAGIAIAFTASGHELPTLIIGNAEGGKFRYARRAGEMQSYLIDRAPDLPRSAAQWVDTAIIDVRGERVRQVTITHADGEVVAVSKAASDAMNFDVASVPDGRELLYPGVANVIGNALRELKLEDVQAAADGEQAEQVRVEYRTFDGLVVTVRGTEQDDQSWVTFEASVDAEQAAQATPAAASTDGANPASDGNEGEADASPAASSASAASEEPRDVAAEAQSINQRVGGWRYRIAGYQYDQMTRRMSDLLKQPTA
jgi:hypothetical protein